MKILISGIFTLLFGALGVIYSPCYADSAGVEVNVGVHDFRWHYYHDHSSSWRARHPWVRYEYDYNHDEGWHRAHPWKRWDYDHNHNDKWRRNHPWHE